MYFDVLIKLRGDFNKFNMFFFGVCPILSARDLYDCSELSNFFLSMGIVSKVKGKNKTEHVG